MRSMSNPQLKLIDRAIENLFAQGHVDSNSKAGLEKRQGLAYLYFLKDQWTRKLTQPRYSRMQLGRRAS